jgi:hypothetical protein
LEPGEPPYDIALAMRVGALDGRHQNAEAHAKRRIAAALTPRGRLSQRARSRSGTTRVALSFEHRP